MNKAILTLAFAVLFVLNAPAQLLYKITGNQLASPSYVLGTYHFAKVSFVDSIPGMRAAMDATSQVYGELDMSDITSQETLQKMQQAMMLPEGTTLQSLLTADEMTRLNAFMKDLLGADMTHPMIAQQMGRMTPEALQTQFTLLTFLKRHPGFDVQHQFDSYFQEEAARQGKPVGGFETMDFQIETLFKGRTLERQKQMLMCLVDNREFMELMSDEIVNAFYSQNLEAISKALNEKMGGQCDNTPEEEDRLIYDRNANWLKLMPAIMADKPTLFVVGAAHLPGERGVLQLLRHAGYEVEGVK